MGAFCCRADSPCGSVEERSGLLKEDSTAKVPTGETVVVGTCGPESDDKDAMSKTGVEAEKKGEHHDHENGEIEPNNTQENGPLQKEIIQTASAEKGPEHKDDSTRAQDEDIKEPSGDSGQAEHLQCTLNVPQTLHTAADWNFKTTTKVPEEENPDSVQDKMPDGIFLTAREVWPEKPSHTETTATREHITESTTHDNDEEEASKVTSDNAVAEPSGEHLQKAPNIQLAAACYVSSSSAVSQEISKETLNTVVTEDSNNGSCAESEQSVAEDLKSHNVPESPGSEPAGLSQSGEERDSVNSVREPETTASADASESLNGSQDAAPDPECAAPSLKEVTSLENVKQDAGEETVLKVHDKDGDVSKASEDDVMKKEEDANNSHSEAEIQDGLGKDGKDEQVVGNGDIKAEVVHVIEKEDAEDDLGNSEEDLYRGAEELSTSQSNKPQPSPVSETTFLKVEDRCSLGPAVDILSYSEKEWKGNTAKSALIRKGYKEMSQRFSSLRRVRGDNYCALRATLFQVLSHSTQLPTWLQEDITLLPKQLEAQEGLISQWTFPGECIQETGPVDATHQLKGYMERLQNTWQAAVDCTSAVERQQLCERVFQGGEEELGLLEALKLLMMGRAVELHGCMQGGGDVPLFCWLLFARDSSDCPRSFLSNHISHVGLSAGLEQVEMFLLGYALQCTIQVYRLYKADTEEFVTYYPDDHKDEWLSVCLVTEDDRHYNVPVVEAAELHKDLNTS